MDRRYGQQQAPVVRHPPRPDVPPPPPGHNAAALVEEVEELAGELAEERIAHQQTLAELEQLRAAAKQVLRGHEPEIHRCDGGDFAIGHADCPIKRTLGVFVKEKT